MLPRRFSCRRLSVALGAALLLLTGGSRVAAQAAEARVAGQILDVEGRPAPGYRVVARLAEGTDTFISAPSDDAGRYDVALPSAASYVLVAVIAPDGSRVALAFPQPLEVASAATTRDVQIPVPLEPLPRSLVHEGGGPDRLFLSFVEDTALVARNYVEFQIDATDFEHGDRQAVLAIGAFQLAAVPGVEFGARTGYADLDRPPGDGSGALDFELWGKLHLLRSANNRIELTAGALLTLPTGDEDAGLGQDALQSKLFLASSYDLGAAALIGHVGLRTTEDGSAAGVPLEGQVSGSVGLGVVVPFSPDFSLAFEATYDGERFEDADDDSRVLVGFNWRLWKGKLRGALAGGLTDAAPDAQGLIGYALAF